MRRQSTSLKRKNRRRREKQRLLPLQDETEEIELKVFFPLLFFLFFSSHAGPPPLSLFQPSHSSPAAPLRLSSGTGHQRLLEGKRRPHEHLDALGHPDGEPPFQLTVPRSRRPPAAPRGGASPGTSRQRLGRPEREPSGEARDADVEAAPFQVEDAGHAETSSGVDRLPAERRRGRRRRR